MSQSELTGPLTLCGGVSPLRTWSWCGGIVAEFSSLGITEISRTVCELLEWKRPNGGLKNLECRQMLESSWAPHKGANAWIDIMSEKARQR